MKISLTDGLSPATATVWSEKVVGVTDGGSIMVVHDGQPDQIRLWGVDCLEKNQDFGTEAQSATRIFIFAVKLVGGAGGGKPL